MSKLSHTDARGAARMVDVSDKPVTDRLARAHGTITMQRATLDAVRANTIAKGDVLTVAKIAGIMAAKRTSELVPLCHPLPLTDVRVELTLDDSLPGVRVEASARTSAQTGVEMEALVAAAVSLVTVYDMVKGIDRSLRIGELEVVEKTGGRRGEAAAPASS